MKTLAEQIAALEAKRAANTARMTEVMQKGMDDGRTTDEAEQQEFDALEGENSKIDGDLKRLKSLQAIQVESAQRVEPTAVRGVGEAAAVRTGNQAPAQILLKKKEEPGVRFARLAKVRAVSRMESEPMQATAERMYGRDSEVYALAKAAVVAGSNVSGNWAADLTGEETSAFADFAAFLRPATILGKFGRDGVPELRRVPFREALISQTSGGSGYWVGEGKPKPLTAFGFDRRTLTPLKVANIAVLTEENIRSSNPSSELIVRDALRDALTATQDLAFIDPTNAGTTDVKPASITNGAAAVHSTGTDADDVRMDVRALFQHFIDADNPPEAGVWIMSTTNALALSLMVNTLGQREFPSITMRGGTFEGMPVIASRYAGSNVALVNASDIYEADEGEVTVDMSREASLEMKDGSLTQDGTVGTGVAMVSLWQSNLVGLRGEKTINWSRRRDSAVAYLTSVAWGGTPPVS
jgi:hypothetical protein